MARNTGLDCDTVTRLKMSYRRMDGDDPITVQNGCSWISKCMIKSCEIPLLQTHDEGLSSTTVGPRRPCQKCTSGSHMCVESVLLYIPRVENLHVLTDPRACVSYIRYCLCLSWTQSRLPIGCLPQVGSILSNHTLCCESAYTPMPNVRHQFQK